LDFNYLRNVPVFEDLRAEELAIINRVTREYRYKKNETVFREGEAGEGFHYVKTGKVKVVKLATDGREHIINILGPGEVFAEVLLFNKGDYPATAIAIEESCVGIIKNEELEAVIAEHPQIALHIIKVLNQKLLYIQVKVKQLAFSDSTAKIAQTVDTLVRRYGRPNQGRVEIEVDVTRQDIANMAGTTRETVSRVFSVMKKDGVLGEDERRLVVLDPLRLRQYYEDAL